jgi:hypothetical protein
LDTVRFESHRTLEACICNNL